MKKADNFDASKWLVENKITTQSRLNENEFTPEKAAEKYTKQFDYAEDSSPQIDFVEGAKWQAERMYSEEEVKQIFNIGQMTKDYGDYKPYTFEQALEQFKKKYRN
jgi:hypothetical protein